MFWTSRAQPHFITSGSHVSMTAIIREELVFIYDFGAGTLDCSLCIDRAGFTMTKVTVLATTGDRQFGGDDVDLAIAQHVARDMQNKLSLDGSYILCSTAALDGLKDREYTQAMELRNRFAGCGTAQNPTLYRAGGGN